MSHSAKKILAVDDEAGLRDLYLFLLEPLGFEVTTAYDGLNALELIQKQKFDLIILDVHMPRMAGPEVLLKICELYPSQKVLIVSSGSDYTQSFENMARERGAIECLFKPIDMDELIKSINSALGDL